MTIPLIPVYGTFSGDFTIDTEPCADPEHWWHACSAWSACMDALGCVPFRDEDFVWTGSLDGLNPKVLWDRLRGREARALHRQWFAGGTALDDYIAEGITLGRSREQFVTIAHSHGGQVALYAAAFGRQLPILITVSTPHRHDMLDVTTKAKPHIGYWIHIYDPDGDKTGQKGALLDGAIDFDRTQPLADRNVPIRHHAHSNVLRNPAMYHVWADLIWPLISDRLAGWGKD